MIAVQVYLGACTDPFGNLLKDSLEEVFKEIANNVNSALSLMKVFSFKILWRDFKDVVLLFRLLIDCRNNPIICCSATSRFKILKYFLAFLRLSISSHSEITYEAIHALCNLVQYSADNALLVNSAKTDVVLFTKDWHATGTQTFGS